VLILHNKLSYKDIHATGNVPSNIIKQSQRGKPLISKNFNTQLQPKSLIQSYLK